MKKYNFYIEIKDDREKYLKDLFVKSEYSSLNTDIASLNKQPCNYVYLFSITSDIGEDAAHSLKDNSIVFMRKITEPISKIFTKKNIKAFSYMDDETFVVKNAYLTAEGALAYLILNTYESLRRMPILIYGFGRLGKTLTKVLNDNYVNVSIATNNPYERALAAAFAEKVYSIDGSFKHLKKYKAIINTVPMIILKGEQLRLIDKNCFLLDLASMPGGIDFDSANRLNLNHMHALGVPGKVTPKSAAACLKDNIFKRLNNINNEK